MKLDIRPANDRNFAENLTRKNMMPYYRAREIAWDSDLFRRNWVNFQNYEIYWDGQRIGYISLSADADNCYLRDLQIVDQYQGRGIGSAAMLWVVEIARQSEVSELRLRVFTENRALDLYRRSGFVVHSEEDGLLQMYRKLT